MRTVIDQAGRSAPTPKAAPSRRDLIASMRQVIRDPQSSESAVDDALEALIELAKLED